MLTKVNFFLIPTAMQLAKENKTTFNKEVDRDSTTSKVQALMGQCDNFLEVMEFDKWLQNYFNKNKIVAILANYVSMWKDIGFLMTIILNVFIFLSFSDRFNDRFYNYRLFNSESISEDTTKNVFLLCGWVQAGCSIFGNFFYLLFFFNSLLASCGLFLKQKSAFAD